MNYEIHITVGVDAGDPEEIDRFKRNAERLGTKGIVLDAFPLIEIMTSSRFQGGQNDAFREMTRLVIGLTGLGYPVLRSKVETDLTNPTCLTPLPNQYFEAHIQVLLNSDGYRLLKDLQEGLDFHVSSNIAKPMVEDRTVYIVTIREYHTFPDKFANRVEGFCNILRAEGINPMEVESEFAIYDSNPEHDNPWFGAGMP
jgi:hypothetical protein